jgi:N-acetylmuramoyl-L-alanine amidase
MVGEKNIVVCCHSRENGNPEMSTARMDSCFRRNDEMRNLTRKMGILFQKNSFVFLAAFCFIFLSPAIARPAKITDVRFWSAPDHTRVVLDLTEPIQCENSSQEGSSQTQVELKSVSLQTQTREMEVNDPFLKKFTLTDLGKGRVKLVFYQKKPLNVDIFILKPYLDKPHRLVIDLIDLALEKKGQEERQKLNETRPKGTKIVVIDPGHGGEDPGAIGPSRTMEKDIVSQIGARVAQFMQPNHDFKVFLTRTGDYFVPLEQRVKIAREVGADLFVSLHSDASFNPSARGSSVYCLSLSGATDEAAKILADKENTSNILGGAFLKPVSLKKDPNLNQILLDLMQNNSMKESLRFAEMLIEDLKSVNRLKYASYRQANFIVLRSPDIPSILFETSYVTNKEDERLLSRGDFQDKIAKTVVTTITKFFKQ